MPIDKMAEGEKTFWVAIIKKRTENGLNLSCEGATEAPNSDVLMVETTGKYRLATGMGPRRGWNEVVVTDPDDRGRIGWCPWGDRADDFWVIWDLGAYGSVRSEE